MTNLNTVVVQGNLVRDASEGMRKGANDTAFGSFTIAVNKSVKNGDEWQDKASYFRVKGFGRNYENSVKWMTKGSSVIVEGSLEQDTWEKDGQKHSEIIIVADRIYPTYKKGEGGDSAPHQKFQPTQQKSQPTQNDLGFKEDFPF